MTSIDKAETTTEPERLYEDLASWWPLLSAPEEYAEEAAFYEQQILAALDEPPRTLLELGSGGGNNALHLKARFEMTLIDRAAGMLAVSRKLNPECQHFAGDMRTVRLERTFDAVFVHDAIVYMATEADLRAAMETAFVHCRPGGVALFVPDHVRETFSPGSDHGGHDGDDGSGMRYLEWSSDPDPSDTSCVVDYAFLLREPDGSVRVEHERHVEGLFPRADWLCWLSETGFEPRTVPVDLSDVEPGTYELFLARKPEVSRSAKTNGRRSQSSS